MLEIIALVFLTKKIGAIAKIKGLKSGMWKLYTVLAWFGLELLVMVSIILIAGEEMTILAAICGIASGFGGYLIIKYVLEQKPDEEDELDELANHLEEA